MTAAPPRGGPLAAPKIGPHNCVRDVTAVYLTEALGTEVLDTLETLVMVHMTGASEAGS